MKLGYHRQERQSKKRHVAIAEVQLLETVKTCPRRGMAIVVRCPWKPRCSGAGRGLRTAGESWSELESSASLLGS